MTYLFQLIGSWSSKPQDGGLLRSGASSDTAPISECVTLAARNGGQDYDLLSDSPQAVSFGGLASASVVIVSCDRKVDVTLTSADGTAQVIPIDDLLIIISRSVPYTALSLTRMPATETHVNVFLGEKS